MAFKTLTLSSLLLSASLAAPAPQSTSPASYDSTGKNSTNSTTTSYQPKVILDNDWSPTGFIPYLQALRAGWQVLGLTSSTSNSWSIQCGLHALATLEIGNLSCIPVYYGSDYPILNTPKLFQAWEEVHGKLAWEGAFKPENLTAEALGSDPTSGSPKRISKAAFIEGYPNISAVPDLSAAEFMVESVRKYPGQVSIYAAGAMTNVALAARIDPSFAQNAKELVIMGGYLDDNLLQTTGSVLQADLQSDINLMIDPEASKIALTAAFPNITIVGNAANQVIATQPFLDSIEAGHSNPYSDLVKSSYGAEAYFPFWDETAAAVMVDPSLVTNSTQFFVDVDTSYASPTYGNIHAYQGALKPAAQDLRLVNYVVSVNGEGVKSNIKRAVQEPVSCADL